MTSVAIPAGITSIDPAFFQLFPNATSVSVDQNNPTYTTYNGMLFGKNDAEEPSSLLLVPEGMEGIAVLPASLATVPACVLSRCTKLTAATAGLAEGSTATSTFISQDGILYTRDKRTLVAAPAGIGASVAIAEECTSIAEGAFWGNDALATIVAPGSVASIVVNSRFKADAASSEDIPAKVDVTTDTAFAPVPSFMPKTTAQATIVTLNRGVWGQAGFKNFADPAQPGDTAEADGFAYTLLDDFTLSVRWVGEGPAPEELTIPQTATINDVQYSVSSIERDAFKGQESIRALTIPEGVRTIGASAFEDCTSLEKATIAGSVISIEASSFEGCTSLAEVNLGGGLRTLGASAFENTALANIWLPASVEQIAERAFAANEHLEYVVAEASVQDVDASALADCTGVEIYVPYNADETYAWRAGVPATGNHLIPYGVSMPDAPLVLNQDETAELLGDAGYLKSEGRIDVRYAYDAAPISVDPSTGTVTAKQTGKTTVTAQLRLNDKLLASASRAVIVALAPKPEEPTEDDAESDEGDHDHDGEETGDEINVDRPETSYKDQLFEEGDYYTSGNFEYEEKVINRSISLASMDADISTMSLAIPAVDSYTGGSTSSMGGSNKVNHYEYDAATKTLTWTGSPTAWKTTTGCGGSVACATEGHGYKYRASRNKLNAIRKLVLIDWDHKNPKNLFSKMMNLEEVEIRGKFLASQNGTTTSGVTNVEGLFADCPQLRVIPSNMTLPSTVTTTANMFGFTDYKIDGTNMAGNLLSNHNQLVRGTISDKVLLTTYAGSDSSIISALGSISGSAIVAGNIQIGSRQRVTSYHTVTFDNQGGSGGHQTVGQSTSSLIETYTIKVPTGSPVPELIGTPHSSGWTFGGYVDNLNNAPKQLVGSSGYPALSPIAYSAMKVTSNMTLKAFWYNPYAEFKGNFHGTIADANNYQVPLPKGYSVAKPSGFSFTGEDLQLWEVLLGGNPYSESPKAPEALPDSSSYAFKGYTLASENGNYANNTAYYDRNRNGTSQVYNESKDFYAMWGSKYTITWEANGGSWNVDGLATYIQYTSVVEGDKPTPPTPNPQKANSDGFSYEFDGWDPAIVAATGNTTYKAKWKKQELKYTISFYSNVKLSWSWQDKYRNSSNQGVSYGSSGTGTSNANYGSAFQITNARSYTRWNSGFFNIRNSDAAYPVTKPGDPNNYAINYRDVSWTAPAYQTLESIRLGSATGTEIAGTNDFYGYKRLTSNVSIYLIFKDETPTDTIKWKANGGYLNGDTTTTEKSDTVKRGTKVTAPTIARANTSDTRHTFLGWYNGDTKVCDAGGQVTANGSATYTAKWKTEYKITWHTGMSGAYWVNTANANDKSNTASKVIWVEAGKAVAKPAANSLKKDAINNDTRWTFLNTWDKTPVTPATGPAEYTANWKTEYYVTWKLGVADAYWKNNSDPSNKTDKADKYTWVESGKNATQPATPQRDSGIEFTYSFKSWDGGATNVTTARELTASWNTTVNKYQIKWDANGGYWSGNTSDTGIKQTTDALGNSKWSGPSVGVPAKAHYTFLGWAESKTGTPSKEITVTKSTTYYAIWGGPYASTIDPNGGEFKVPEAGLTGRTAQYIWYNWFVIGDRTLNFNVRKADGTFSDRIRMDGTKIERPGYTFSHWEWSGGSIAPTSGSTLDAAQDGKGSSPGATYKAIWKENDVTVKYQVGTRGGGSVSRATETVKAVTGTLQGSRPTHNTGWHFVGWNTKADGTGQTLSTDASAVFVPTKQSVSGWNYGLNVANTYYAIFAPNGYTIELMKNDGTGDDGHGVAVGSISAEYDTPWTVRGGNVPNRRGYYFVGWDTNPDYAGMTPRFPHAPEADGTFRDKQFGEWVDGAFTGNLTTAEDGSGNAVPTTVKLYAIWNESRYTVIFDENWSQAAPDETRTGAAPGRLDPLYTEKVTIPGQNGMVWQGHYFAGWNTRADGSGTAYRTGTVCQFVGHTDFDDAHVRGATVHLYAQWEPIMYLVMFDANTQDEWSVVAGDQVLTPHWGDTVTIETEFARPGYEFVGWSHDRIVASDASGTPLVDYKVGDTFRNLTDERNKIVQLYAQWKGAPYQIIFDANADDEHHAVPGPSGPMAPLDMFLGVGRALPKNTYECPGFSFKGWNTAPDGSGDAYTDTQLVQDIPGIHDGKVTLYAQWSPVISMTSPINAHIEVYIDGMDVKVVAVKPGSPQEAIESHTRGKLFVETMELDPNLDPEAGMARIFPVDGAPTRDSWEDFTLEFTALNEDTGKQVKSSIDFGNGFAFLPGQRNNYYVPAYDTATSTPGRLPYKLSMSVPEGAPVRYSEDPVQVGTLIFTCSLAE